MNMSLLESLLGKVETCLSKCHLLVINRPGAVLRNLLLTCNAGAQEGGVVECKNRTSSISRGPGLDN
jgi:hypothetical protein